MNLFPFVPLSSLGDGTSRDLLLNFSFEKRQRERERGDRENKKRRGGREILRGVGGEI